ncbi:MAG: hypothetical protein M3421_13900 [Bacteroidota bacterium]|nr:hypothetical protein [Bacteroidota bacterium]
MIFPTTDPTRLIQMRDSIYATDLLILATGRLDFFSWLSDNPSNFENICSHFKLDPRPADVMLTLFHSYELVYKQEGIFYNSPLAEEHLTSESSWSLVPYYAIQTERPIVDKMYEVLTTGVPASWGGKMD